MLYGFLLTQNWGREGAGVESVAPKSHRPQFHMIPLASCGMWWVLFHFWEAQCIGLLLMLDHTQHA